MKYSLAATLVKSADHWKPNSIRGVLRLPAGAGPEGGEGEAAEGSEDTPESDGSGIPGLGRGRGGTGAGEAMSPEELAEMLYRALEAPVTTS